jgi:hypothetical protein
MSDLTEIIVQLVLLFLSLWFISTAVMENRKAEPLTMKNILPKQTDHARPDVFIAIGFVMGLFILTALAYKVSTCGLFCW